MRSPKMRPNEYRARIEITKSLLAAQLLRARGSLNDREAELLGIVESSVRNLKELVADGVQEEAATPGPAGRQAEEAQPR